MALKYLVYFCSIFILFALGINFLIMDYNDICGLNEIESSQVALVLGARVYSDNRLSPIFKDRLDSGLELYNNKKANKILVSGDHGTKKYDEVNSAKKYLLKNKVKEEDIFLDHAGFDTYDSLIRAKKVFSINEVIIVSQNFHLNRALYIADKSGLKAIGYSADKHIYMNQFKNTSREFLARIKAFLDIQLNSRPKFLGIKIDIYGDGRLSWD